MAVAFTSGDALNAIVADVGQYATKIGFAGEDYPRSYFRSNVAVLREELSDEEGTTAAPASSAKAQQQTKEKQQSKKESEQQKGSSSLTQQKQQHRRRGQIQDIRYDYYTRPICDRASTENGNDGDWEVCNPVDPVTGLWYNTETTISTNHQSNNANNNDSAVVEYGADWMDLIPTFLRHGYKTGLGTSLENHPLMMVERSYNIPPLRQQMIEILFEECNIPAVFLGRDATMACYACGRTTGTVVDIGYGRTTITPVYDGYVEQKGINISPIGTRAMDECIVQYLDQLYTTARRATKQKGSNSKHQQFLPIYQVRDYKRRIEPFHHMARLEVAQHCREQGAGAAIHVNPNASGGAPAAGGAGGAPPGGAAAASGGAQATFNAPHLPFELPDKTLLNVPSAYRFGTAQLLLGNTYQQQQLINQQQQQEQGNNIEDNVMQQNASFNSNETYQKFRRGLIINHEKQFSDALSSAWNAIEEEEKNNGKQESIKASEKYSEAAAVGISSRSSRRGGTKDATNQESKNKRHRHGGANNSKSSGWTKKFSNYHLQYACHNYLQTIYDNNYTSGNGSNNPGGENNNNNDQESNNTSQSQRNINIASIPQRICNTAFACDRDQQGSLLSNIIICGGGACIGPTNNTVMDYIKYEVEQIIHVHTPGWRVKVLSPNEQERSICSWLGGSILGSLGTFHDMWITKAEYEEYGSAIVNRKCP